MYICTLCKSQVSESLQLHVAQFPHRTQRQSRYYLWVTEEQEPNFSGKLYSIWLTSCEAWRYQTCVAREYGCLLVLHNTAKGVACETRSKPPPLPASLAVGSTPRAKRTRLLDIRNVNSLCLHFCGRKIEYFHFYVYKWIRVRKWASFLPENGGVQINRVYELLEILQ